MSTNNDIKWEAKQVKELGEKIGYGNMMIIASVLWRKMLIEKGGNGIGAFVPALIQDLKKSAKKEAKAECDKYDSLIYYQPPSQ